MKNVVMTGDIAQVVEYMASTYKSLGSFDSNPWPLIAIKYSSGGPSITIPKH